MKPIPDFEGYFINEDGEVFSELSGRLTKMVTQLKNWPADRTDDYGRLGLRKNGKTHQRMVHRMMIETFVGPIPKGMHVRHLNGKKSDNRLSNLKIGTPLENAHDNWLNGKKHTSRIHLSLLSKCDVEWIKAYPVKDGMFSEMARKLQINVSSVARAYRCESWL
jgi:hypothetical protein